MELSEVGVKLGVDNRVLRYLMEQKLVPGLSQVNKGRGSRRKLTIAQARLVGVAALMHVDGFRPPVIIRTLKDVKKAIAMGLKVLRVKSSEYVTVVINVEMICEVIR